jgi:Holliday junction resolvase
VSTAHKGRRAEHRARKLLEAAGYTVTRAAGSKGAADLVAWNTVHIRLLNIKSGTKYCGTLERETFALVPVPPNATKEIWRFPDRCVAPLIEVVA